MTDFERKLIDPPKRYRPLPFWSWNDKLEIDETVRQIRQMNEAGLGGFFMHARGGLQTDYLSDEWFGNVAASIDEGEKLDMSAWGYDENGWPSGSGDGAVTALGEKYRQKMLKCIKTETPVEDEFTISNVRIGECVYHCFYTVNPYYVDTLNADVTAEFLKSTHEKYRAKLNDRFEKMSGFFTDEPRASRDGIPWSEKLSQEYHTIYKEDIKNHLPKLFFRIDGYEEFRFRFWKLVRDLFTDNYMAVVGSWCSQNGVELTGHMVLEENYYEQILANGCCMPSYEFMDIPGMDHIGRELPSIQTEMQLSSVAQQLGKKQVISETFAACGWNVSFEDMRRIYEHQMVHGINLLCQHLESYSLRGLRKRDYPASLFRHQPWWNDYKVFNDTVSRIGMLLSEGEAKANILVLNAIESGWLLTDDRDETDRYAKKLIEVMTALEDAQLQYHLGESRIIGRYGSIDGAFFKIGKQSYSVVVIPAAKCLDENVFNMLCLFKNQGGRVIFCEEIPEYIDGIKTRKVADFANDCAICGSEALPGNIPDDCRSIIISDSVKKSHKYIRSTLRRFADQDMTMYYICNFGEKECDINIDVSGKSAVCFDAVTGKIIPAFFEKQGNMIKINCNIPSNSSTVFFVYDNEDHLPAKKEGSISTDVSKKLKGDWHILRSDDNSIILDYCDLSVDGEKVFENIPVSEVQEFLCSYGKPVNVEVVFRFFVRELSFADCKLMIETPELFDIFINGYKIPKNISGSFHDDSFKTIDIYKHLKKGENQVKLSCLFEQSEKTYKQFDDLKSYISNRNRFSYDAEIEAIYLKGDFGVFSVSKFDALERNAIKTKGVFYLDKSPLTVRDGALESQGYPFFAGSITLSKRITLSKEEASSAVISFEKLPSIVTGIYVNGRMAGKILWKPYSVDISEFAVEGENEIEITLTGSLRNLLGPFHLIEGETYSALPFYFFRKTGIWGWADGINKQWTDDYSFVQNGLFLK